MFFLKQNNKLICCIKIKYYLCISITTIKKIEKMSTDFKIGQKVYCPVYDLIGEVIDVSTGGDVWVCFKDKIFDQNVRYNSIGKLNKDYSLKLKFV